jgi:hypothetical protein
MGNFAKEDVGGHPRSCCLVSWSSIIAGALVAFSLSALLNLLNTGLGLMAFPETFRSMLGVSAGGYIWLIICAIVAMFLAGLVAGHLARHRGGAYGALHGFLAWSLALLLTVTIAVHIIAPATAASQANADRAENSRMMDQQSVSQVEQAAEAAGTATLGIFFIFLVGAISAGVGGFVGAKCCRHCEQTKTPT